jgi:hypothetical protein
MTICVAVRVAEGLVLSADSTVALMGVVQNQQGQAQQVMIQSFNYANKVTHFKDYPVGVLAWGLGSIEARSIQSLIGEFEYTYAERSAKGPYTVKEIGDALVAFIKTRYDAAFPAPVAPAPAGASSTPVRPILGLLVGGFSHMEFFSSEYVYVFPDNIAAQEVRPNRADGKPDFGVNWYGMTDALIRLILGYDENAMKELINRGADATIVKKWVDDHVSQLPLVFDGMPIQDAIDFADYATRVVIGRFRFATGAILCGGDVDIAVITPDAFRWAQKKRWGVHHE